LGAAVYDRTSGLALFPIPKAAPPVRRGSYRGAAQAADYQESKNVDQAGANILPNTTTKRIRLRGVVRATVTSLLPLGTSCPRGEERLNALADELGAERERCDVADRADVERVAAAVRERHPAVDLLVNNAGIPGRGGFLELEPERIEALVRVNYLGAVWCLRAF